MSKDPLHRNGDTILDTKHGTKFVYDEVKNAGLIEKFEEIAGKGKPRFKNLSLDKKGNRQYPPEDKEAQLKEEALPTNREGDMILDKKYDRKFKFNAMEHGAMLEKLPKRFENLELAGRMTDKEAEKAKKAAEKEAKESDKEAEKKEEAPTDESEKEPPKEEEPKSGEDKK